MHRNVTLSLEETVLLKAKHMAVENKKSLSRWLTDLIQNNTNRETSFEKARKRALKRLKTGFASNIKYFSREELHERT